MESVDVLSALALGALAAAVVCLVQLHRLAPEVLPVRDPVSNYGAGEHASWYRVQVVLVGLGSLAIWFGLRSAGLDGDGSLWMVVFALSRVLIAGFPVDLPGEQRTQAGTIHNVLALAAFASIAVTTSTLGGWLADTPAWPFDGAWYRWSGTLVAVIAVMLAVVWIVPALRRSIFGLAERCWYVAMIAWLALTASGLLLS